MNCNAGFLKVKFFWLMMIVSQSSDASPSRVPLRHHFISDACRPKELAFLSETLIRQSLTLFNKWNGNDLPPWSPGFPELHTPKNGSQTGSEIQCSLLFLAQALDAAVKDQQDNINPRANHLHNTLKEAVKRVKSLTACLKEVLGGECSSPGPPRPHMPNHTFERKLWGHTLLLQSTGYLAWLQQEITVQKPKVRGAAGVRQHRTHIKPAPVKYFEGSTYLL